MFIFFLSFFFTFRYFFLVLNFVQKLRSAKLYRSENTFEWYFKKSFFYYLIVNSILSITFFRKSRWTPLWVRTLLSQNVSKRKEKLNKTSKICHQFLLWITLRVLLLKTWHFYHTSTIFFLKLDINLKKKNQHFWTKYLFLKIFVF